MYDVYIPELSVFRGPIGFFRNTHKVGSVGTFVLLTYENRLEIVISHINLNSTCYDSFKFALKLIQLVTISNLFLLKATQNANVANAMNHGKTRTKSEGVKRKDPN